MLHVPETAPPAAAPVTDDRPVLLLLAALCELARKDASAGDAEAAHFLAELAACRPRRLRRVAEGPAPLPAAA